MVGVMHSCVLFWRLTFCHILSPPSPFLLISLPPLFFLFFLSFSLISLFLWLSF